MSFSSGAVNLTESWRWQDDRTSSIHSAGNLAGPAAGVVAPDGGIFLAKRVSTAAESSADLAESSRINSAESGVVLLKLDGKDGSEMWVLEEGESSGVGEAPAVAVAGDGDVIFAGTSSSLADGYYTLVALKLSGSDGDEIWRYQDPADTTGEVETIQDTDDTYGKILALAVDSRGNALFVGEASGKLDGATGEKIWGPRSQGPAESYELHACTADSDDNLVAAGFARVGGSAVDVGFATKIDGDDGDSIWTWQDQTNVLDEVLLGVALDADGDAYVAGGEGITDVADVQIGNYSVVVKLDGSNGREIWRYSGAPADGGGSIFRSVAVDDATQVVLAAGVTGGVWHPLGRSEGQFDFLAVALNATTGEEIGHWQGGTSGQDLVTFAGFDSRGALYLGGYSSGSWAALSSARSDGSGVETSGGVVSVIKFEPPGYGEEVDGAWSSTLVGLSAAVLMALLVLLSWCAVEMWRRTSPGAFKAGRDSNSGAVGVCKSEQGLPVPDANHSGKSTPIRGDANSTSSPRGDPPCVTPQPTRPPWQHRIAPSMKPRDRCREGRLEKSGGSRRGIMSSGTLAATRDRLSRRPTAEDSPRRRPTLEFASSLSSGLLLSPLDESAEAEEEQAGVQPHVDADQSPLPVDRLSKKLVFAPSPVVAGGTEPETITEAPRQCSLEPGIMPVFPADEGVAKPGALAEVGEDRGSSLPSVCRSNSSSSSSELSSFDGNDGNDGNDVASFPPPKQHHSPRAYASFHSARSTASFATETSAVITRRPSSSISEGMPHGSVAGTEYSEWSWSCYGESVCADPCRLPSTNASISPRKRMRSPLLPRDFAADDGAAEEHQASAVKTAPELSSPDEFRVQRLTQCNAMWDSDAGSVRRDSDTASEESESSASLFEGSHA